MYKQIQDYPQDKKPEWNTADPTLHADDNQITAVKNYFEKNQMIELENQNMAYIYDVIDI